MPLWSKAFPSDPGAVPGPSEQPARAFRGNADPEVNLAVQTLIHGFRDDLPETEEAVAAFLDRRPLG